MLRLGDIHQHLIYGLDDGAQTFENTQEMLLIAQKNNVNVIAATPHVAPGIERFDLMKYRDRVAQAQSWINEQGLDIRVCFGSEILYTSSTERLLMEGYVPTLNGTNHILVEFSPNESYENMRDALRRMGNAGYTAVVAHAERYDVLRKIENIIDLKEQLAVLMQINANTVLNPRGFWQKVWLKKILKNGLCDVVATDAHNNSNRACHMKACYELIKEEWGNDYANELCIDNPLYILGLGVNED